MFLQNNHLERVNKPVYLIDLKAAEEGRGAQFACTQEQLQVFHYYKLSVTMVTHRTWYPSYETLQRI